MVGRIGSLRLSWWLPLVFFFSRVQCLKITADASSALRGANTARRDRLLRAYLPLFKNTGRARTRGRGSKKGGRKNGGGNVYSPAQYYNNYILQTDATGTYYQPLSPNYGPRPGLNAYAGNRGPTDYHDPKGKSKAKSKAKSTKYHTTYHRDRYHRDYHYGGYGHSKSKKAKGHSSKSRVRRPCKPKKYKGGYRQHRIRQPGHGYVRRRPKPSRVTNYVYQQGRYRPVPAWHSHSHSSSSDSWSASLDSRDYTGATWVQSRSSRDVAIERYYYYGNRGKGGPESKRSKRGKAKSAKGKGGPAYYDYGYGPDYGYQYDYGYGYDDYYYDECVDTAAPTFTPYPTFTPFPSFTPMPSEFEPTTPRPTTAAPTPPLITEEPTSAETERPTVPPGTPTMSPTKMPTASPTMSPTKAPTLSPTLSPTKSPTMSPTKAPTQSPTVSPTKSPTMSPTKAPTQSPTTSPTVSPTMAPTVSPTISPTNAPTVSPTLSPTMAPTTGMPTIAPTTGMPTVVPTTTPTAAPQVMPTIAPSTGTPTAMPSAITIAPTVMPSADTTAPTGAPTSDTIAPTGALEVIVPFQLEYMIDPGQTPSDADLQTVEALTNRFLEEIFLLNYDFDPSTTLDTFGLMLITQVDDNGVVTVDYEASLLFGMDSAVVPSMADVEAQIAAAFEGLNLEVYLDLLQNTSANNAFMSTTDVRYMPITAKRSANLGAVERYRLSAQELFGVIGAGVIVLLGVAVMYYDREKRRADRQRKVALTI